MEEKRNKGITLVVLVVTIIILLIISGVAIVRLNRNVIFEKAKLAKEKQANAQMEEDAVLNDYENKIIKYVSGTRNDKNISINCIGTINISTENRGGVVAKDYFFTKDLSNELKKLRSKFGKLKKRKFFALC